MIAPPARLGVLGGGQLGRYTVLAARVMGYGTVVVDPDPAAPAGRVADEHLVAAYDDPAALDRVAARCAVVTTEFENPPAAALERLGRDVVVAPLAAAVAVAQDRVAEKRFLEGIGVPVAPWRALEAPADLAATAALGAPLIVKAARLGYDGRGQVGVADPAGVAEAWDRLGRVRGVVERRVPLDVELSVVVARTAAGRTAAYPVAENHHRGGVLDLTVVPARIPERVADRATALARDVAERLAYVGVLAVELFVVGGELLVNELAPRPHNSGHWTLDAAVTDQFSQQVRAVTGAALGATAMTAPAAAMVNLLGDLWPERGEPPWGVVLGDPAARLHLYGKAVARPGRKMGHITVLGADPARAAAHALALRAALGPG